MSKDFNGPQNFWLQPKVERSEDECSAGTETRHANVEAYAGFQQALRLASWVMTVTVSEAERKYFTQSCAPFRAKPRRLFCNITLNIKRTPLNVTGRVSQNYVTLALRYATPVF